MPDKKKNRGVPLREGVAPPNSVFGSTPSQGQRLLGNSRDSNIYLNPNMPKDTPAMRAPSYKERIMDVIGGIGESISEQPLVRILSSLNRDLGGEAPPPMEMPDGSMAEWKIGAMPDNPRSWGLKNALEGRISAPKLPGDFARRGGMAGNAARMERAAEMGIDPVQLNLNQMRLKREIRPNRIPVNETFGGELAPNVKQMHPAVPPEFHAVDKPRLPQSRTAPIDMNNLPSGSIEYLDPDVAEYMNPKRILDFTTPEAQRRLRFLTGK